MVRRSAGVMMAKFLGSCTALVCLCALADATNVDAQAVVPERLTLADAVRIAAERHPSVAMARNDVEIAQADRLTATRRPNPAVTLNSESYPLFESPRPAFANGQEFVARVDQEIERGGRRTLRTKAADAGVEAAEFRARDRVRQLALEVRRAYFQVVLAKADLEVANGALGEIDRVIDLNRARAAQGEISGAELRRLQVERLRFVDDVFAAELTLRNARATLLTWMNVSDLTATFDVVETLQAPVGAAAMGTVAGGPNATALRTQALATRPDVLAAGRDVARADTETQLQRALRTPNVTVGGGYKRDFGTNAVVVGITVPLPLFNRNPGGIARADAERRRADNQHTVATLGVALDVQHALNAFEIDRQRVQYIEREYLSNARESRDIVLASYRLGAANLIDFLDAQRAFRDTVRTYNRALYDCRVSQFQLAAAVGDVSLQP
jgi:cobalt-zinc-cadmium efflux system outer membrane protein